MADTRTIRATCLCGAAAHELTLPASAFPLHAEFCHCTSCRRMTGTLFLSVAFLPESYKPSQDLLDKLVGFDFTRRIIQYHCRTCGTIMLARCIDDPDKTEPKMTWDVSTGTLEKWDGVVELKSNGFVHDTADGGFTHFMPEVDGKEVQSWSFSPNKSEKLPLHWRSQEAPTKSSPSDKLHAQCKCGGVEFWISRPTGESYQARSDWPDLIKPFHSGYTSNPENTPWWICANGTKYLAGTCTCNSCRLVSGIEVVQWAFVPKVNLSLDAEGQVPYKWSFGTLKTYRSSEGVDRHFCTGCGAMVFYTAEDRSELLDVAIGLLDAPEGSRAETWLEWRTERLSYREDAIDRAESLVVALEKGLKAFDQEHYNECDDSL